MANISELKFDDKNFNKHTAKGMGLLEKSLQQFGAGRSILIDKDNNIIAGNGIIEAAGNIGLEDLQIVETDGTKIVAVKRTDVALDSEQGREMALADNATAAADLEWDRDTISEYFTKEDTDKWDIDLGWDEKVEVPEDMDDLDGATPESSVMVFTVSTYAREKDGGSTILAQTLTQEDADRIQAKVESEGGEAVMKKMLEGLV